MAVSISISIAQNSQNVVNNTSNVTVTVKASWTQGSHNALVNASGTPQAKGWVKIDGVSYDFASTFNTGKTTSGSQTICTKTVNVNHATNGSKTLTCSASYATGVSSGTVTASASKVLTTIPRKSTLSAPNGTLGTALTLTVTRQHTGFTHTIAYLCGTASATIVTKSSSTSISWTPPLSFAAQYPNSTSVSVGLNITTYNGDTAIGIHTIYITCAVPASVAPTVSISVSDPTGYLNTYGGYVQGLSKIQIAMTANGAQGSTIKTRKITVNGKTFSTSSLTTDITESGKITITAAVTDSRSRSATTNTTITVLPYTPPVIHTLTIHRVNINGIEDDQGEYALVSAHAAITNLSGKNVPKWVLKFKKSTETIYTEYLLGSNVGYVWNGDLQAFPADTGSSYDVILEVSDNHNTTKRATSVSTAFTIMNWKADGTGMGIGKVAEESNLLDIGLATRFNNPVHGKVMGLDKLPEIPPNSDFNDYLTTGCWATYRNEDAATMSNIPIPKAGRFEVSAATGEGIRVSEWSYLRQKFIPYSLIYPVYERDISRDTANVWTYGEWQATSLQGLADVLPNAMAPRVLWEGGYYMTADHTINLSQPVSAQKQGIVLVFSAFTDGAAGDYWWHHFFVPKNTVVGSPASGHCFTMAAGNFSLVAMKYLMIADRQIKGHDNNNLTGTSASGITFTNNRFVLRAVYGV